MSRRQRPRTRPNPGLNGVSRIRSIISTTVEHLKQGASFALSSLTKSSPIVNGELIGVHGDIKYRGARRCRDSLMMRRERKF